ncbi:hypothetical protein FSARC_11521 [Fusarium sarcochroum]|uniref:Uncharacterized protein n=1 Tax=Fusarium sarcochroum TaxID=1208366 RepID=A0A8H4WZK6_9HYPO|nr:hypothetical protein FSARC_11521 [Fusarium sarcochroum]
MDHRMNDDLAQTAGEDPDLVEELDHFLDQKGSMSSQAATWATINPQKSSPFFNCLPPEIRIKIYRHALSEHDTYFDRQGHALVPIPEPRWLMCELPENTHKPALSHSSLKDITDVFHYFQDDKYPHNFEYEDVVPKWIRPGTAPRRFQYTELPRTCRRVFIEARDLLMQNATIRLFLADGYPNRSPSTPLDKNQGIFGMERMTRYAANRITSMEIHLNQPLLEDDFLHAFRYHENLRCIKNLRIILSHYDWGILPEGSSPQLTPYGSGRAYQDGQAMKHMELTKDHAPKDPRPIPPIPYNARDEEEVPSRYWGTWGEAICLMPNLRRFTIDFEDSEEWFDTFDKLTEWAQRVWTFRLGGKMKGFYLSAQGNAIKKYSWRGPTMNWTAVCGYHTDQQPESSRTFTESDTLGGLSRSEYIDRHSKSEKSQKLEEYADIMDRYTDMPNCCAECSRLDDLGLGKRMYTFSVTWTARKLEPEDGDDPDIPGPDDLKDSWPEVRRDVLVTTSPRQFFSRKLQSSSEMPRAWRDTRFLGLS